MYCKRISKLVKYFLSHIEIHKGGRFQIGPISTLLKWQPGLIRDVASLEGKKLVASEI
jgi:hypothetical protein